MIFNLITCLGLVWILRFGSILSRPRNLLLQNIPFTRELFNCSLCLGFWVGLLIGFLNYEFNNLILIHACFMPLASSAVCWFFDGVLDLIHVSASKLDR